MSAVALQDGSGSPNPLDLLEEIVGANDWSFDRTSDDELVLQIAGGWCKYRLHFAWCVDLDALHFSCALDIRIPEFKRAAVYELLAMANGKLFAGHFDLTLENGPPIYRHTFLLRGSPGASVEQLEDLLDIAISECERFYPAFQYVIWGGQSPVDALATAMLDTVGEA